MSNVASIMSKKVHVLFETESVHVARMLMKNQNIRHIPIINTQQEFVGLLTPKAMLSNAMTILDKAGIRQLEEMEKSIPIANIMHKDVPTATLETSLIEAGQYLIENRHSCLPVLDADLRVQGIITSVDFVKLCMKFLQPEASKI